MAWGDRSKYKRTATTMHAFFPFMDPRIDRIPDTGGVLPNEAVVFDLADGARQLIYIVDGSWRTAIVDEFAQGEQMLFMTIGAPDKTELPVRWALKMTLDYYEGRVMRRHDDDPWWDNAMDMSRRVSSVLLT